MNLIDKGSIETFAEFGADKAGVYNFEQFLRDNDFDRRDIVLVQELTKTHNFVSRDKQLVMTFTSECGSNSDGRYFHYLGATGEVEHIYRFITSFVKYGYYAELCYGGRDFV